MNYDINNVRINTQQFTCSYIIELARKNLLCFAHDNEWFFKNNKKSLFIESMFMRIPIQSFYLHENKDGSYNILDGNNRIHTIVEFANNHLTLSGLEVEKECNEHCYSELGRKNINMFLRTIFTMHILDVRHDENVVFNIINRIK